MKEVMQRQTSSDGHACGAMDHSVALGKISSSVAIEIQLVTLHAHVQSRPKSQMPGALTADCASNNHLAAILHTVFPTHTIGS
jgi:hypothetical protein